MSRSDRGRKDTQLIHPSLDGAKSPSGLSRKSPSDNPATVREGSRAFLRLGQSGDLSDTTASGRQSAPTAQETTHAARCCRGTFRL